MSEAASGEPPGTRSPGHGSSHAAAVDARPDATPPLEQQMQEAHAKCLQLEAELAVRDEMLQQYEREREIARARGYDFCEKPNDDTDGALKETIRHKIHGGPSALAEVLERELERLKGSIIKQLLEGLGKFSEAASGGDVQINLALDVSSENDSAPVSVELRLNGERKSRSSTLPYYSQGSISPGQSTSRSQLGLDSSVRSPGSQQNSWHPERVPAFGPNFGQKTGVTPLASPKPGSPRVRARSPREISMQSPRNRYSPTNKDPKWGFRHDVDLNNHEGALNEYRVGYDVATLKAHTVVRPGTSVNWSLRIVRLGSKYASRFGIVSPNFLAKKDWSDHDLIGSAWYFTAVGFFNGASLCERRQTKIKANDILGLHLVWTPDNRGTLKFTLNGVNIPGDISGITGPVQLACQLLNKRDEVIFIGEEAEFSSNDHFYAPRRGNARGSRRARGCGAGEGMAAMDSLYPRLQDRSLELWSKAESSEVEDWVQSSLKSPDQHEFSDDLDLDNHHANSPALTTLAASLPTRANNGDSADEQSKDTPNNIEHIKTQLMIDVSRLQAELRLVVAERDDFREKVQRQLMLDAEKNRTLEFLQSRTQALELQVDHRSSQMQAASRELAQQTALRDAVVSELENTRNLLADRIRVSANLERQLRESRAKLEDPDFGGKDWREPLSQRGASSTRHGPEKVLKTPRRHLSPHSQNTFSKSPAGKNARAGSAVIGASSAVKLTEDLFNMRPRLFKDNRPLSAPSTRRPSQGSLESQMPTGLVGAQTPQEKKIMRAGIDPRSGSSMARVSRDTARMRPQHGTVLERKGPKEALLAAAASDNLQVALDILSLVEDPERKAVLVAQTLAIAAKNGCEVVCKGLVDMCRQQDLDAVLFPAAQHGQLAIIDILLERGANVDSTDGDGATPVIISAFHGQALAVSQLLKAGAKIDISDCDGYTALMWASFKGRSDTVSVLLKAGADANATSREGNTALIYAAYSGGQTLITSLIPHVTDLDHRSALGLNAKDVAEQQGHHEAVVLLQHAQEASAAGGRGGGSESQEEGGGGGGS